MKSIIIKTLFITILSALLLSAGGCSSYHRSIKRHHRQETAREKKEREIVKEAEEGLKGQEKKILDEAREWLGTPYSYGRQDRGVATDCSGLVMQVFDIAIGCKLPRNSAKQAEFCETISHKKVKPGDLVFFATGKDGTVSHVGIMINQMQFIHASSSKGVVISSMEQNYYRQRFKKYGRVPCLKH